MPGRPSSADTRTIKSGTIFLFGTKRPNGRPRLFDLPEGKIRVAYPDFREWWMIRAKSRKWATELMASIHEGFTLVKADNTIVAQVIEHGVVHTGHFDEKARHGRIYRRGEKAVESWTTTVRLEKNK